MKKRIAAFALLPAFLFFPALAQAQSGVQANAASPGPLPQQVNAFITSSFSTGAVSAAKPPNVPDTELIRQLADLLDTPANHERAPQWNGPVRIAIVDPSGKDADLSIYPGNIVKSTINILVYYAKLPLIITKIDNHNNNASIILPVLKTGQSGLAPKGNAGALYGVPELASYQSEAASGLFASPSADQNLPSFSAPITTARDPAEGPNKILNNFIVGQTVKACALGIDGAWPKNVNAWQTFENIYSDISFFVAQTCLQLPDIPDYFAPNALLMTHPLYLRRLTYVAHIKPGMTPKEIKAAAADFLSQEPKPAPAAQP